MRELTERTKQITVSDLLYASIECYTMALMVQLVTLSKMNAEFPLANGPRNRVNVNIIAQVDL